MSEIADFLRARYAEDAQAVRANWNAGGITSERYHGTPIDPTRLLDDLDAKLALVDEHPDATGWDGDNVNGRVCRTCGEINHDGELTGDPYPCRTLRLLAQPFAGHADHKGEEWTP